MFYDFEYTQNTLDTETDRSVHKVNYSVAMSDCGNIQMVSIARFVLTFIYSVVSRARMPKISCMWAFDV